MDIWLAKSSSKTPAPAPAPAPVVVAVHGGGFVGGDKNLVSRSVEPYTEKGKALRASIDLLRMIDKDDPPVLLINPPPNELPGDIVHHPRHSIAIKKKCDEVGAPCSIVLKDSPPEERIQQIDFIAAQLGLVTADSPGIK